MYRPLITVVVSVAACVLAMVPAGASQMGAGCGMAMGGSGGAVVPPDNMPQPLLMTGIGDVRMRISSRSPEAQQWFTQGLNLFYDFWDYESARAFEQAVRVDPKCAICYWGLYEAEAFRGQSTKPYALTALDRAQTLERYASAQERLYIQAALEHEAALKAAGDDGEPDKAAEIATWRKAVRAMPGDTNAPLFLAEAVSDGYDEGGKPLKGQQEARRLIGGVLKQQPENSAANHYWIHAVEAGAHPEEGLHSAAVLGGLAPASGHMVHMPGHIYYRTGDYARAEAAFAASEVVDERYLREQHVAVDDDWNYVHNLMYAIANLMEQGKLEEATALSAKLTGARGQREETLYVGSARDSIARIDPQLPVAMRTGEYARVAEMVRAHPQPASLPHLQFLAAGLLDFAAGMQALREHAPGVAEAASGKLDAGLWRASEELKAADRAEAATKKNPEAVKPAPSQDARLKPLVATLSILSLELRGALLIAKGQVTQGRKLFDAAQAEQKDLGYREPPSFIRPVGETEGELLLRAGKYDEARAAYQQALKERPNSGFPLYGLAQTDEESGDAKATVDAYRQFLGAWKDADTGLPELTHARAYLEEHERVVAAQ